REVMIHADDSSNKGGAWYPLSAPKIVRALEIAIENRLPVVHLCDSAGGYLEDLSGVYVMGGRVFRHQCILSKMGIPQVAVVLGHCTAGGAYVPALCEHTIMVRGTGAVFLGGPPLVKAATGEEVTVDALGGADMHTSVSGTADYAVDSEEEGIALARTLVSSFSQPKKHFDWVDAEAPYYDPRELYGIIPVDYKTQFDMREVIARMVDASRFQEYQPNYGTTLVCGWARLWGCKVGLLGNNGVLFSDSSLKAAHFIQLCNQMGTPMIFLQNTTGYMIGRQYEEGGITKDGAKMLMAQAGSEVPKLTVVTSGAFGAGYYGMCGRAWDPRMIFSWPQAKMGVMGPEQAGNTLADVKLRQLRRDRPDAGDEEVAELRRRTREKCERETNSLWYSARIQDDGVLDPLDTRNALGIALSCAANVPVAEPRYGVYRM
ncbi:MAG: acyl-CoA carboxylase subunit beta, partial [Panacagrimonas sp.]